MRAASALCTSAVLMPPGQDEAAHAWPAPPVAMVSAVGHTEDLTQPASERCQMRAPTEWPTDLTKLTIGLSEAHSMAHC